MIYVIAGNERQAEEWRRRAGLAPRNVRYIGSGSAGRGTRLSPHDLILVGTWWEHPNLDAIEMALGPAGIPDLSKCHQVKL